MIAPWIAAAHPLLALDAGCGPIATFTDLFASETRLVAVDCSLDVTRSAARRLAGRDGSAVSCGSVEHLPLSDGAFDFVLSLNCLEFVADPARALREFRRVAAPRATAVIAALNRRGLWELTRRMRRRFDASAYYSGRFLDAGQLTRALSESGWSVDDVRFAVRFPPVSLPHPTWYRAVATALPERASGLVIVRARASA